MYIENYDNMRLTILMSLILVVLIAAVNGNTVLGKIKEKLTPTSSHHDEHEEDNKSVLPDRKQISERLPSPPSLDEEHRLRDEHHERERGNDESSFLPPPSSKSGEMNVRENTDKRETENPESLSSIDRHERVEDTLNPLKMDDEKLLGMQNPSDVHQDQRFENLPEESKRVDASPDQQTSEFFFKGGFGRPYYGGYGGYGYRPYGYGYPPYRTYGYYPGYYQPSYYY